MRVVVADDHPVFRMGLCRLLESVPDVEVVGEAWDTDSVVETVLATQPDVVVMDLHMPGGGGVEATQQIRRRASGVRVLVLTMHSDAALVSKALRAGARGYVLKDASSEEILRALAAVHADQAILDASVADRVFAAAPEPGPFPQLTERETDILERMAAGLDNEAIARRLGISVKTVQNHVSNVLLKLGARHRGEAIARARDAGIGN
ncbi:DNA-binding response regulator [Planotetraspora thailandica]|uniref:DNA-binding response regulator n=1 Tax=Planotetraspora thailandica TaxID=487172 RepID=A0A8J3XZ44_9ACTN|nr:response regulator transcription factor [Planotetraspora thailandica]GII56223.1 DNA-binding response regulator [Planotetraspora thailandica]